MWVAIRAVRHIEWLLKPGGAYSGFTVSNEPMSTVCEELHRLARRGTLHTFPFDRTRLPKNGIYVLFEKGEDAHGGSRIVRIGTHTGDDQLPSRLNQHFVKEHKDRSIFRKNIGRALLNRSNDPYLAEWDIDRTTRIARQQHGPEANPSKRRALESEISTQLQGNFSFVVFRADGAEERLYLEARMISTVSLCKECGASASWLGRSSPKNRIRESGLWLVNELYKEPLSSADASLLATRLT